MVCSIVNIAAWMGMIICGTAFILGTVMYARGRRDEDAAKEADGSAAMLGAYGAAVVVILIWAGMSIALPGGC